MTRPVELVIDEVVLRGVDPLQAAVVSEALQARLATLVTEGRETLGGLTDSVVALRSPRPARAALSGHRELGARLADAVWQSITGEVPR